MIRSMTGYGQGAAEAPGVKVTVELRSVNNRFADLKMRLPEALAPFEQELRRKILATVKRGRIDVDLRLERTSAGEAPLALNRPLVAAALQAMRTLREEYGVEGDWDLRAVMAVPGIFQTSDAAAALDDSGRAAVDRALELALAAHDAERRREGGLLAADLVERVTSMAQTVVAIRELASAVPPAIQKRIAERVQLLTAQLALDPGRIAQEAALLAERADITEEIVRLTGHLEHALTLLAEAGGEPVGKRLEFLLQEILRETNTIASKSGDLGINRQALTLKAEAEKIREQIQNLE